jgi:hypothetical protein
MKCPKCNYLMTPSTELETSDLLPGVKYLTCRACGYMMAERVAKPNPRRQFAALGKRRKRGIARS